MKKFLINQFSSLSLRSQLLLLALLLALPAIVLIIYTGSVQRKDALRRGFSEARRLVDLIAMEQYNLTGDVRQLMIDIAQIPDVKKHNAIAVNALLGDILKKSPQYGNIIVADPNGDVWASALPMVKSFSMKDRSAFQSAIRNRRLSPGVYNVGIVSNKSTIGFGYPIIDANRKIVGVIATNLDFDIYKTLPGQTELPSGAAFSIIDRNGVIIYRNQQTDKFRGKMLLENRFLKMKSGKARDTFIDVDENGERRIISYRKLQLAGEDSPYLYIRAGVPIQGVLEKARRAQLYSIISLSFFLLVVIFMALPIGNYFFIDRIRKLQEASKRLAGGDMSIRVSGIVEGGELGELGRSFDEMAQQLNYRETALRNSESELNDLYNNAPCGYHSLNIDGVFIRVNDTLLNWLGYEREEVVDSMKFTDILSTDGIKQFENNFALFRERGWLRGVAYELTRKNGMKIPVLMNASAIYDRDGLFLMSRSTTYDISELKQAEQELRDLNTNLARRVDEETDKRLKQERLMARHARLAAIGEMIGAIAHQWRQPLATLGATIQSIRMAWEEQCLNEKFLESAESDARMQLEYMSDTIEGFRNFFSPEKVIERFDIREKIDEVVLLIAPQFNNSGIRLNVIDDFCGAPSEIRGYQNEFKQAVLNLVSNSFDAINTKAAECSFAGLVELCLGIKDDQVVIEVRDNGGGIPAGYADKVFEPYFTSKAADKGTGIGLYMSRLIIEESMGGRLGFTSGPEGTVFRIEIPRELPEETNANG